MSQQLRHLVLKLRDGTAADQNSWAAFSDHYAPVAARYPGLGPPAPLFPQTEDLIGKLQKAAVQADPSYAPTSLVDFIRVPCDSTVPVHAALRRLRSIPEVALAFVQPRASGPHDPRVGEQKQLDKAPVGVDALFAWEVARGAGVQVAVVERGWWTAHPEFQGLPFVDPSGAPIVAFGSASSLADDQAHGTETLGILCAGTDADGIEGVANGAAVSLYSYLEDSAGASENLPAALLQAVADLQAGDVILLEVEISDDSPYPSFEKLPAEYAPDLHAVIRLASALGIAVIEPAGNAGADLDAVSVGSGWKSLDRTAVGFEDSGALMVGAANADNKKSSGTNRGNRVDLFARGESVLTTARQEDAAADPHVYAWVDGTSSASAAIAGVAALFQSRASVLGHAYSPWQLRWLLSHADFATPSLNPGSDRIGSMPDLAKLLAGDGLPATPDLYLRDHLGDDGAPHDGALARSPDLILRRSKSADPEADFGASSGLLDELGLHESAVAGATHWLYARAFERNGVGADEARVRISWSAPATLILPEAWTLIGEAKILATPAGGVAVSDYLEWSSVPDPGHYCFLGLLDHAADPAPVVPNFAALEAIGADPWEAFKRFLRASNNATWRNFNVVAAGVGAAAASGAEPFFFGGATDRPRPMRLVLRSAARAGEYRVTVPSSLCSPGLPGALRDAQPTRDGLRLRIPAGEQRTLDLVPPPRSRHRLLLEWTAPAAAAGGSFSAIQYELAEQRAGGEPFELGRVSWTWKAAGRR